MGMAQGTSSISRKPVRPRSRLVQDRPPAASPMVKWKKTLTPVQMMVHQKACWKLRVLQGGDVVVEADEDPGGFLEDRAHVGAVDVRDRPEERLHAAGRRR